MLPWQQIWGPSYLPAPTRGRERERPCVLVLSKFEQNFAILRPRYSLQLRASLCSERERERPPPSRSLASAFITWALNKSFLEGSSSSSKEAGWCQNLLANSSEFQNMPCTSVTKPLRLSVKRKKLSLWLGTKFQYSTEQPSGHWKKNKYIFSGSQSNLA